MVIDCSKYRNSWQSIYNSLKNEDGEDRKLKKLTELCVVTHLPLIVGHIYYMEMFGESEKVKQTIEALKNFYNVEEIKT